VQDFKGAARLSAEAKALAVAATPPTKSCHAIVLACFGPQLPLQDFKEAARLSAEAKALTVAAQAAADEAHSLAGRLAALIAQQAGQSEELQELQAMKQVGSVARCHYTTLWPNISCCYVLVWPSIRVAMGMCC
jgi:hypothetical protein